MQDRDWLDAGACRDLDPELFFTTGRDYQEQSRSLVVQGRKVARRACARCWVKEQCFWDAMVHPDQYATRAGLSPGQLAKLRRENKKAIEAREALLSRVA